MDRAEIIERLRMLSRILEVAPRRMSPDGGVVKALIPVNIVAAIQLAADELEDATP